MTQDWMDLGDLGIAKPAQTGVTSLEVTHQQVMVNVPLVGNQLPGEMKEGIWEVFTAQLEQAPKCALYSTYDARRDQSAINRTIDVLASLGYQPHPLLVLPAEGQSVELEGQIFPKYYVYTDLTMFYALRISRQPKALVRLPPVQNEGGLLLLALSGHQLYRPLTTLQLCDAVLALCSPPWKYNQELIAQILAANDEFEGAPSQETISRMCQAARQPPLIRELMDQGMLKYTHVRTLFERVKDEALRLLVARYAVQKKLTADGIAHVVTDIMPPVGKPVAELIDLGKTVELRRLDGALRLVADKPTSVGDYFSQGPMTKQANIRALNREAQKHHVIVVPSANPDEVGIEAEASLATLRNWVNSVQGVIRISELEETCLGVILAARNALAERGLLTNDGKIAPVVADKSHEERA